MVVTLVARTDSRITGLAKYTYSLYETLVQLGHPINLSPPLLPPLPPALYRLLRIRGIDLSTFLKNYPLHANLHGADVCHLSSQNLATLLRVRRLPPTVVTVHDLYHLMQQQPGAGGIAARADRLASAGIKKARALIAISEFTKQTIVDILGYPAGRINVIYRSVDTNVFKPQPVPADFRARYGLPAAAPLILFLGSEDPRKNLVTLIRAFSLIVPRVPDAMLVKAGAVHFSQEAARLRQMVQDLGLTARMAFVEGLPDADLPVLYNAADIVVMPSLFEGFGLPALEAMACGRPVVAANATSLPEVVGTAGILFDPQRPDELAIALVQLLEDADYRQRLGAAAVERARLFSPEAQAKRTWDVYSRVYAEASPQ